MDESTIHQTAIDVCVCVCVFFFFFFKNKTAIDVEVARLALGLFIKGTVAGALEISQASPLKTKFISFLSRLKRLVIKIDKSQKHICHGGRVGLHALIRSVSFFKYIHRYRFITYEYHLMFFIIKLRHQLTFNVSRSLNFRYLI